MDSRGPVISVIIPTLNEEDGILELLESLPSDDQLEKIVVDGGSSDGTLEQARKGADRVLTSAGGKSRQMNRGAAEASGDILWFLHADTKIAPQASGLIRKCLQDSALIGGAFRLSIDSPRPALRVIEWTANLRTRLTGVPYGDQGIFIRRNVFEKIGGFPDYPLMEDLELGRRMKREGKTALLPAAIRTSARRWEKEGLIVTTIRNQIFILLYFMGVSPKRLAQWYRPVREGQ